MIFQGYHTWGNSPNPSVKLPAQQQQPTAQKQQQSLLYSQQAACPLMRSMAGWWLASAASSTDVIGTEHVRDKRPIISY